MEAVNCFSPLEVEENVPHDDGIHTYISIQFPLYDIYNKVTNKKTLKQEHINEPKTIHHRLRGIGA